MECDARREKYYDAFEQEQKIILYISRDKLLNINFLLEMKFVLCIIANEKTCGSIKSQVNH